MADRFDLEQQIMDCWHVVDDLKILSESVCEHDDFNRDKITNITMGLEQLYQLKFDKLFRTFESVLREEWDTKNKLKELTTAYENMLDRADEKEKDLANQISRYRLLTGIVLEQKTNE
jgi:hypothetical protein